MVYAAGLPPVYGIIVRPPGSGGEWIRMLCTTDSRAVKRWLERHAHHYEVISWKSYQGRGTITVFHNLPWLAPVTWE